MATTGSSYVRSIRQGGRDIQVEGLAIGELQPEPIEVELGSHGATIQGTLAVPASNPPLSIVVGLFRRVNMRAVLEKQAYVNGAAGFLNGRALMVGAAQPVNGTGQFTIQGVAPGEYVLFAWPADAQIEYAEPDFLRQFDSLGTRVQVAEDVKQDVVIEKLLPTVQPQ